MCLANALKSRDHPQGVESREPPSPPPPEGKSSRKILKKKIQGNPLKGNHEGARKIVLENLRANNQGTSLRKILKDNTQGKET